MIILVTKIDKGNKEIESSPLLKRIKMDKPCTYCKSKNTIKTEEQYLDTMRDYFCNDCDKDFTPKK